MSALRAVSLAEVQEAGGYSVGYFDCPWTYRQGGRGAARNHYATMGQKAIEALPIDRLMARDAVIFSWATWPCLPEALAAIAAWGFTYKTLGFLWVKHYGKSGRPFWGGGHWSRSNSEPCLLAVRGDVRRVSASVHQLVEEFDALEDRTLCAPPGAHSAKPPEVRDRIVQLMGETTRIELFARERVPGWDSWGNEVESDVALVEG